MQFEFDEAKSRQNKQKHGIDFVEAQALWQDKRGVILMLGSTTEVRFKHIGKIGQKHWAAIVTYRNNRIRIISVRRARKREIETYEEDYR